MSFRRAGSPLVLALVTGIALCHGAIAAEEPKVAASAVLEDHYPERRVSFPGNVTGIPDLTYSSPTGYRPLKLDLYIPSTARAHSTSALPLVIYIHGGGWSAGHSRQAGAFEDFPRLLASIAARGYAVASINYRLSGEARFPAPIQDVKAAIRWLHVHATTYGFDPARTVIWGGSAGGHLAALAATTCKTPELEPPVENADVSKSTASSSDDDCVRSAVIWYGVFDFAPIVSQPPVKQLLGCADTCSDQIVRLASPVTYVKAGSPDMLLIAGTEDKVVNPDQSRQFDQALEKAGVPAKLILLPGVGHSFIGPNLEATRSASLAALKATLDFFDTTVGTGRK